MLDCILIMDDEKKAPLILDIMYTNVVLQDRNLCRELGIVLENNVLYVSGGGPVIDLQWVSKLAQALLDPDLEETLARRLNMLAKPVLDAVCAPDLTCWITIEGEGGTIDMRASDMLRVEIHAYMLEIPRLTLRLDPSYRLVTLVVRDIDTLTKEVARVAEVVDCLLP